MMPLLTVLRRAAACLVLSAMAAALAATGAAAADPPSREARIRAAGQLRVCIWPAYFAISYRDPKTGQLEGLDIDMAKALAADLGVRPAFVDSTFATFMDDLEADRCDIAMFGVGITERRRQRVAFSTPTLRSGLYAVTTKAQTRIRTWNDIDQRGNVVAVQDGTFMEPLMRNALKKATITVVAPPRTREAEIESGRADVFISDFPYTRLVVRTHDWVQVIEPSDMIAPTDYAYAMKPGDAAWLARVDAFVAAAKADGRLAKAADRFGLTPILRK
ncbi:substrate-binding periplasmic protein [Reyranella sp.]|uniref:substrate-binding periplasmic protein n=1 Tax=Reyranella sp. TaxID=1929291 RepID=UPI003BAB8CA5